MRIATLQFAPQVGDIKGNFYKADTLLNQLESRCKACQRNEPKNKSAAVDDGLRSSLDLLVLPELAFTGYNFISSEHITPYLETVGEGPSSEWARSAASRLGCTVAVGYPEKVQGNNGPNPDSKDGSDTSHSRFNSLFITSPTRGQLQNYQKRFLYYTDDRWAEEGRNGKGFFRLPLSPGARVSFANKSPTSTKVHDEVKGAEEEKEGLRTAVGICMDINPYKFTAPWDAYEFATHVKESKSRLVILSMAWLTTLDEDVVDGMKGAPDMDTFKYWVMRFWPLLQCDGDGGDGSEEMTIIVFANRCGVERGGALGIDDAVYAGSSCVMGIQPRRKVRNEDGGDGSSADIYVWEMLGMAEEGVLYVDTEKEPTSVFRVSRGSSGSE